MTPACVTANPYSPDTVGTNELGWPEAGGLLLQELDAGRELALIPAGEPAADHLIRCLTDDLGLGVIVVGRTMSEYPSPPKSDEVDAATADAAVLLDLDLLLWPDMGVPLLPFLRNRARRRTTIAVWPGEIVGGRARYSAPGRPDHTDERLAGVLVLRPRPTAFPDEVPYVLERPQP